MFDDAGDPRVGILCQPGLSIVDAEKNNRAAAKQIVLACHCQLERVVVPGDDQIIGCEVGELASICPLALVSHSLEKASKL